MEQLGLHPDDGVRTLAPRQPESGGDRVGERVGEHAVDDGAAVEAAAADAARA